MCRLFVAFFVPRGVVILHEKFTTSNFCVFVAESKWILSIKRNLKSLSIVAKAKCFQKSIFKNREAKLSQYFV